jgi:nitrite reductase/ring-hydroxylating ferredoxin subunit
VAIPLCQVDDIPEGSACGFTLQGTQLFAVKKRGSVFVYLNRCPHLGIALDWVPDSFLDSEGLYIRCANHGAFFEIDTGNCIMGPCLGEALWSVDYMIAYGMLMIDEAELPESPRPA